MPLDPADAALAAALNDPLPGDQGELLTRDELAERTGMPSAVLEALAREGLLLPRHDAAGGPRYAAADAAAVHAGMALLEAGLPLGELLDLARHADAALGELADHAVETFLRFVRDPVHGTATDDDDAAARLVGAFRSMLPATSELVGHHFQRLLLERARQRATGDDDAPDDAPDAASTPG